MQSFQLLEFSSAHPSPVVRSRSTFWDTTDSDLNSRRVASVESLPLNRVESLDLISVLPNLTMVNMEAELNSVRPSQRSHKSWITRLLNDAEKAKTRGTLTLDKLKRISRQIEDQINKILDYERQVYEIYTRHKVAEDDPTREAAAAEIFYFVQDTSNQNNEKINCWD